MKSSSLVATISSLVEKSYHSIAFVLDRFAAFVLYVYLCAVVVVVVAA